MALSVSRRERCFIDGVNVSAYVTEINPDCRCVRGYLEGTDAIDTEFEGHVVWERWDGTAWVKKAEFDAVIPPHSA